MTEDQWNNCNDATAMLEFLRDTGKASERQCRLFACACVRRAWAFILTNKKDRKAIEITERYADGLVGTKEFHSWGWLREREGGFVALFNGWDAALAAASSGAGLAAQADAAVEGEKAVAWETAFRTAWDNGMSISEASSSADDAVPDSPAWIAKREAARRTEQEAQAALLRDIFQPFRPPVIPSAWLTPLVVSIAQQAYDERDFASLPVLADALDEADCTDAVLLGHLREPGPHWRGCWATDLVLGKS